MLDRSRALIVIDIQNDYFSGGAFPLWRANETLAAIEVAVGRAQRLGIPVILVQHVVPPRPGVAPFFTEGTSGVEIHPHLLATAPGAPVVIKAFADSFYKTTLDETLRGLGAQELLICGMMTQNCVTHTAISKAAERYKVSVFSDCSTTVDAMIHNFALRALAIRVDIAISTEILA
jgi:nicotinamidase-related amidase